MPRLVAWQYLLLASATLVLIVSDNPWIWISLAFVQGFTIFNFTVLLHEVVHNAVFVPGKKSRFRNRVMGLIYAFPSVYNLAQIQKILKPFYRSRGMKAYGYAELFYRYIILNKSPQANWEPQLQGEELAVAG